MKPYSAWTDGSFVYFIKPVNMPGPIKIGCSQKPDGRLDSINAWCPFKLEMLVSIPGTFDLETRLHKCFAEYHTHGEWFSENDKLTQGINALKAGVPVEEAFDLSVLGNSIWPAKRKNAWTPEARKRRGLMAKVFWSLRRMQKNCPDGVWFTEPAHIQEIWDRSHKTKELTSEDISQIETFLASPETLAVKRVQLHAWRSPS